MRCVICTSEKIISYGSKNGYALYRCLACNLVFVWPAPTQSNLIYTEQYFKNDAAGNQFGYTDYDRDKAPMKNVFLSCLQELETLTSGRSIFDVGAATGYFLNVAKDRGWQTAGIDISAYAAETARRRGHVVQCGALPETAIDGMFAAVTMWDVLEHLNDSEAYLKAVNKLLVSDEGWLLINTIDRGSLWARLWGKRWHLLIPPEHVLFFSIRSLEILLQKTGFEIYEMRRLGKKFSLSYICNILYHWQGWSGWRKLSAYFDRPRWRKVAIPINLRDNIFIIAKKIHDV